MQYGAGGQQVQCLSCAYLAGYPWLPCSLWKVFRMQNDEQSKSVLYLKSKSEPVALEGTVSHLQGCSSSAMSCFKMSPASCCLVPLALMLPI